MNKITYFFGALLAFSLCCPLSVGAEPSSAASIDSLELSSEAFVRPRPQRCYLAPECETAQGRLAGIINQCEECQGGWGAPYDEQGCDYVCSLIPTFEAFAEMCERREK